LPPLDLSLSGEVLAGFFGDTSRYGVGLVDSAGQRAPVHGIEMASLVLE
jgi:hypothetical protein